MVDSSVILYSHVIPPLIAFISILIICSGIMDKKTPYTILGILLFFAGGLLPFLVLPVVLGS
ncbi:hypothetical protein [Methanobacterium paludis]|uniref:Uncharacterized protein n=1 Tax=Methanobacterium paludis (strain DSM 25820 / JCM 18151 / SWAN1) TaxID=868131 RepID=F6D4M6_METPW|nr:hypothetical protein [Methanobacterium paludis]AEG17511.1 hypothetical protein MSWAN_0471 [Methanobacterium paludis]